ncbi:hydrogenase formation protein HypD [Candidatus Bathyarchaeota archaeon]|nr:hydrogenase formation protein HypD [Candidatus Bathyarchaeota archaeon]
MSDINQGFRDIDTAKKICKVIKKLSEGKHVRIVHVCGTHEDAITKNGLRSLLPLNIEVLMGPGCPVCTVPPNKIDSAIKIAESGAILTTFGDMIRVPAIRGSLADAKSRGADIRIVYSIHDATLIAEKTRKEVVHFGIGFETTAPTTASELLSKIPNNFSVYPTHLLIPPAMKHVLESGETKVDGFINPGHVSAIIGVNGYKEVENKFKVPQVIAGFEPLDILFSIVMILKQLKENRGEIENAYTRIVKQEGNLNAIKLMNIVFDTVDASWRGIGTITKSGFSLKNEFEKYDASKKYDLESDVDYHMPSGCRCGDVLKAIIYPWECPLYNNTCTPQNPIGPCMVSQEGSCYISAKYGVEKI